MYRPKRIALVISTWPELELYCPNWNGMQAGLRRMGIDFQVFSARPHLKVQPIIDYQPDLIIYGLMEILYNTKACEMLRHGCQDAKIVFWYGDYRDARNSAHQGNYAGLIDAMFVSNDAQSDYWKKRLRIPEVYYLPLGAEPLEKPAYNDKFNLDFVFVGGLNGKEPYAERAALVHRFVDEAQMQIISSYEPAMRAKVFKKMPEIYSSAKITLDVSHFTDVQGYTSNRFFVIPAFWGLPLTKRFPGCLDLYPEDTRAYFDTFEEAVTLKDHYLTHPKEADALRSRAHAHSFSHTYDKRFATMFSHL